LFSLVSIFVISPLLDIFEIDYPLVIVTSPVFLSIEILLPLVS